MNKKIKQKRLKIVSILLVIVAAIISVTTFAGAADGNSEGISASNPATVDMTPDALGSIEITLDPNGGALASQQTISADTGDTITLPRPKYRQGYNFVGWEKGTTPPPTMPSNGTPSAGVIGSSYVVTETSDFTFYAVWQIPLVDLSYRVFESGVSFIPPAQPTMIYDYGSDVTILGNEEVRYPGHELYIWRPDGIRAGSEFIPGEVIQSYTGGLSLVAVFRESTHEYEVKEAPGTLTGYAPSLTGTLANNGTLTLPTATQWSRTGYPLQGWDVTYTPIYGAPTPPATRLAPGATYTAPMDDYAKVEFTPYAPPSQTPINFNINGGTGTTPATIMPDYDSSVTLPTSDSTAPASFYRLGYDFLGWQKTTTPPAIVGDNGLIPAGTVTSYTVDTVDPFTFYAVWQYSEVDVVFDAHEPSGESATGSMSNQKIRYLQTNALTTNAYAIEGYDFVGWSTSPTANPLTGTIDYGNTADYTMNSTSTVTLYAIWKYHQYNVTYDGNGGAPAVQSRANDYMSVFPDDVTDPVLRAFDFMGWTTVKDDASTLVTLNNSGFVHNQKADMTLYALWQRSAWEITFDVNGGELASQPDPMLVAIPQQADITIYQPDAASQPVWEGYGFLGWKDQYGNTANDVFSIGENITLTAQWIFLSDLIPAEPNVDIYKDESNVGEIESHFTLTTSYTDLLGGEHTLLIHAEWDHNRVSQGGVENIKFYIEDPRTKKAQYSSNTAELYVLNRAYIEGYREMYFLLEEFYPGSEVFQVHAFGELPNTVTKSVDRVEIPLTSTGLVDTSERGRYPVSFTGDFTDSFNNVTTLKWDSIGIVAGGAGGINSAAGKELGQLAESSKFWKESATIYHGIKAGQVVEVNQNNVKNGGTLLNEKIPANASYDRLIKITPGDNLEMSPVILDLLKKDQKGELQIFLGGGRTLTFNSEYFKTNTMDPKGSFDLRMDIKENEKVSALIPEGTASMQLHFAMNRSWQAEPYFTLPVNEALVKAGEAGSDLYLFNYNEQTNELELVGRMDPRNNGNYGIRMGGFYGDYVITANLPTNMEYRITEQTNVMDSKTYGAVANNIVDSGRALPAGSGFNALATAPVKFDGTLIDGSIASEKTEKNSSRWILIALLAGAGVTGGAIYRKKRKENDD